MKWFLPFILIFIALTANAVVNTPNMSLVQPTIGTDTGLTWEQSMNANASTIDSHNHTPGSGVQIPPAGLNINSALTFQNNQATNLQASVYTPQVSLATLFSVYAIGNDLYYNDGAGNIVRLTSGGTVNAISSGISGPGGASAAFSGGVLIVVATASTPGNISGGSLLMGNNTPNSKFLTLSPPGAMAANISETLPTIPSQLSIMQMDSSGNISAQLLVDGTTLANSGISLSIATAGVGTSQLANSSVTQVKMAATNIVQSSSGSGLFTTTSTSAVNVTNLSVSITTSGHPVELYLKKDPTTSANFAGSVSVSGGVATISALRAGSAIDQTAFGSTTDLPASAVRFSDSPSAGTYTYTIQVFQGSSGTINVTDCVLVAHEIL